MDKLKSVVGDDNLNIILRCIKLNCEKGNEVIKILFKNGFVQRRDVHKSFEMAFRRVKIHALRVLYSYVLPGQFADFKTFRI